MRTYDHEEDKQQQLGLTQQKQVLRQQFDDDYNFSKMTSEINQLNFQVKSHDSLIKKMQRQIDTSVSESQLTQTIAFINAGIHQDPNMIKLLKTKEDPTEEEEDKVKMNASLFGRKLNQMSESLSVLLAGLKRLQNKITSVQSEFDVQLNQKFTSLQLHLEEARGQASKQAMEVTQKMELLSFQVNDKMRDMDTKVNWRLNEFKTKIDQKINEQMVLIYLGNYQKKIDKNMREFQIKSNIDPERIDKIEQQINDNKLVAQNKITECSYTLRKIKEEIKNDLVKLDDYSQNKIAIQKRLSLFNQNFMDVYKRVIKCENEEAEMKKDIDKLLADDFYALQQLKRVNSVLLNLKISDDFQRMLQEMNPTKVLELQDTVNGVKQEQNSIFGEIAFAKRQIAMIAAKSQNMGFLMPNKEKDKLKKQEIYEILDNFLKENQFAQKISNIDKQVTDYKNSMDSVVTLSRQVARLQKQSDYQRLSFQMKNLQQYFKKQLTLINNRFRQKYNNPLEYKERQGTNSKYSLNSDSMLIGESQSGRSFSTKKLQQINALNLSKQSTKNIQMIEIKNSKNR